MGNKYNFKESEKKWQEFWIEKKVFRFDPKSKNETYSVDTPPATVSGDIHIGHAFSYTQAEMMVRYKRMCGYNVFYPFGTDTNGLPTERLVEKIIGKSSRSMPKEEFVKIALDVVKDYINKYKNFWLSLGYSNERDQTYTTIQPEVQKLAQQRFIELFNKKRIFRKKFPALWSTTYQTSVAQAEVEDKEFEAIFYDIQFSLENGQPLTIATTRPELIPACRAIFVNPEDDRYQNIIGKYAITPLGEKVKILADDKAKIDKGSGAVMCCTYGDETDVFWTQKHGLQERIIIDQYGKIYNSGIEELNGLKIPQAREKIIEILKNKGVILKETPIVHDIGTHERDGSPIEIIPVEQRFVDIISIKDKIIEYGKKMNRFPKTFFNTFRDWTENIHWDWCITRNKPYGIPIPVWYSKKTGEPILPDISQLPIDPLQSFPANLPEGHTKDDIIAEKDVFDTRFISGFTPDINAHFIKNIQGYDINEEDFLPMSMRPHAKEIIRTWDFYAVVHSLLKHNNVPFFDVMVSGRALAKKGEKISKSKGNAKFTAEEMIDRFGADAVRYRACSGQLGKDIIFEENELKNGQRLVTKLRNAFQFVKMQLDGFNFEAQQPETKDLYPTDKRIISRLNDTIQEMRKFLDQYEYGLAKIKFEEFFWKDFCDTYLEMIKFRLYKPNLFENGEQKKFSGQWTLVNVFYNILKLIAPYMPHITEEIYQEYFHNIYGKENIPSIHVDLYPTIGDLPNIDFSKENKQNLEFALKIIEFVRSYKTTNQLSLGSQISKLYIPKELSEAILYEDDLKGVTQAQEIIWNQDIKEIEIINSY